MLGSSVRVLDHGYVKLIDVYGSDERIVESARMSTDGAFRGWGPVQCVCEAGLVRKLVDGEPMMLKHAFCEGTGFRPGDEKLLQYLWKNKHTSPFEMCGLVIEVQAPIFVFRQWHRHRTQSYNELSARYTTMPNLFYVPTEERIKASSEKSANKQASGTGVLNAETHVLHETFANSYSNSLSDYQFLLDAGVSGELARCVLPVGIYSRMRAGANLLNWLKFITLRDEDHAQWETRQFAREVTNLVKEHFPRTYEVFSEGRL